MQKRRSTSLDISKNEFREIGYRLIDDIAELLDGIRSRPVTSGESPDQLQEVLGRHSLPQKGRPPSDLITKATELLFSHSLFNGHPRFLGYITSSPAPVCALADLLATAVNQNAGAQILSPLATEIEKQTVAWLAGFIGVSPSYGGLLVSGGNMANFTGFLTGLRTKVPEYRKKGFSLGSAQYRVYCSKATHTWIDKAAGLFGLGTDSLAWIGTDSSNRMDLKSLGQAIRQDKMKGLTPVMVIGTAGDVSTGAVDDLRRIASICNKYDLWLHVDGAYGIPAAILPELKPLFDGIEEADSIALDPHKWLYSSLEAGCTLVKDPQHLTDTYSSHPAYYNFETAAGGAPHNYYEYGLQNSRGFRALKVWLMLQQSGRDGYINMIREDIRLSKLLYDMAAAHPELEAITQNLSVAVFRYVPLEWIPEDDKREDYLNKLNEALLNHLQSGGEVFLSNAMADERYCLRACIVNFRTTEDDIRAIMEIIVTEGRRIHNLQ